MQMKKAERFKPHLNLKGVYRTYLAITAVPLLAITSAPIWLGAILAPEILTYWPFLAFPPSVVIAICCFVAWWIGKYYDSIFYTLTENEVMVERGVWWKMKHAVPYARVMSIDVVQGPISRKFGVGTVDVHTAGYTGPAGGSSGPGVRRAEASLFGVNNFIELRDRILETVKGRPLFGSGKNLEKEMLKELQRIRKAVER
ncbi:MAG: PH domain-containing protein [Candidatus Hadarchaeales archaeon]